MYAKSSCHPHVLFVGNLSFFCEESHLFELFNEYGHVQHVRIVQNDSNTRSLMFGFVTMLTHVEAKEIERLFNNHMFMGRRMKVALSDRRGDARAMTHSDKSEGIQIHVNITSFFPSDSIVKPTEAALRKIFMEYGQLLDCSIKEYRAYENKNVQEGYGFLTVTNYEDALHISSVFQNISIAGFTIHCSLTHQHNPSKMFAASAHARPIANDYYSRKQQTRLKNSQLSTVNNDVKHTTNPYGNNPNDSVMGNTQNFARNNSFQSSEFSFPHQFIPLPQQSNINNTVSNATNDWSAPLSSLSTSPSMSPSSSKHLMFTDMFDLHLPLYDHSLPSQSQSLSNTSSRSDSSSFESSPAVISPALPF